MLPTIVTGTEKQKQFASDVRDAAWLNLAGFAAKLCGFRIDTLADVGPFTDRCLDGGMPATTVEKVRKFAAKIWSETSHRFWIDNANANRPDAVSSVQMWLKTVS